MWKLQVEKNVNPFYSKEELNSSKDLMRNSAFFLGNPLE